MKIETAYPTWGAQVSRKVNLGNYETCEVSAWVAGVPFDMPEDQVSFIISSKVEQVIPVLLEELERRALEAKAEAAERRMS